MRSLAPIPVNAGQLEYEWRHLLLKLTVRNPALHDRLRGIDMPECHPSFIVRAGPTEAWERP